MSESYFFFNLTGICELKNLHELDLSDNMFGGNLPECLKTLSSLRLFDVSSNRFSGMLLPSLIANLTSLEYIDVSHNKFEGSFSFSSFSNHTKLEVVELLVHLCLYFVCNRS
ncbi:putative leucine-rich repeat domain superfamily [Helianthus debilis subsp. tardiflorus]